MYLILDIGNTAVKAVHFAPDGSVTPVPLDAPDGPDGWTAMFADLFHRFPEDRLAAASVVPVRTAAAQSAAGSTGRGLFLVTAHVRLPLRLAYTTPDTLGADRIAAAVGGWLGSERREGQPLVVVDAGTAVTYEVVDGDGTYLGGAIAPGPALLLRSLTQGTAQLPAVPLIAPPTPVGRSTREALQAGVLYGFVDGVEGMLRRISGTLAAPPAVVLTGGWGAALEGMLDAAATHRPHLVHEGILHIARLNGT